MYLHLKYHQQSQYSSSLAVEKRTRNKTSHSAENEGSSRVRQKSKHWTALRPASVLANMRHFPRAWRRRPWRPDIQCKCKPPALRIKPSAFQCINDNDHPLSSVHHTIMPPKVGSTKLAPQRLPPLPKLRVRRPNKPAENPCVGIMISVLGNPSLTFLS